MKTWRIRIKRTELNINEQFPRVTPAVAAKALAAQRANGNWNMLGVFGVFIENYEKRYIRKWGFTSKASQIVLNNLRVVIRREGLQTTLKAIETVFQIKWIRDTHDNFLAHKDNFEKYVVPEMLQKKEQAGEQSEWEGTRSSVPSCVVDKDFFR